MGGGGGGLLMFWDSGSLLGWGLLGLSGWLCMMFDSYALNLNPKP